MSYGFLPVFLHGPANMVLLSVGRGEDVGDANDATVSTACSCATVFNLYMLRRIEESALFPFRVFL